jgi:HEAT repeat protein
MKVRAEATGALARSQDPSAYARLDAYLARDPNANEALEPLGRVRNEVSLRLLRKIATDSQEVNVRIQAMLQLVRARDMQSMAIFEEALRSSSMTERVLGAEGMAGLGEKNAVPRLIKMMQRDPHPSGQLAAIRALGHLATKESLGALSDFVAASSAQKAIVREAQAILDRQKDRGGMAQAR